MLEGNGFKFKLQKSFEGTHTAWNKSPKPALIMTAPVIAMAVGAKTKIIQVAQATTKIFTTISGGKRLIINRHAPELFEIASYVNYFK